MGLDERGPFGGRAKEPHTSSITAPRLAERAGLANIRSHADQDQHVCRPPSTPMLNRFYLFYSSFSSSFFYLAMGSGGWAASLHRPNPSSGIYDPNQPPSVLGGSMVASMADQASQRPETVTCQGLFQA